MSESPVAPPADVPPTTPLPPDIFADYDAPPPSADRGEPDDAGDECGCVSDHGGAA
jgi:hypothetical protein